MGLDFFKNVVRMQQKYGRSGSIVSNGLQTNASLIDKPFAKYLAEYKFLLGVSLDGPENIHDHHRKLPVINIVLSSIMVIFIPVTFL